MTKNKILLVGLLVSISINLFFIGGIAFRVANFQDERSGRPLPPNVGWVVRDLEESRRSELEPQLRESFAEIDPIRREMMNAQRQVNELMSAQPFYANKLNSAFATLREANIRYQTLSHEQTSEILELLTEEERQAALEFVNVEDREMVAIALGAETANQDPEDPAAPTVNALLHLNQQM